MLLLLPLVSCCMLVVVVLLLQTLPTSSAPYSLCQGSSHSCRHSLVTGVCVCVLVMRHCLPGSDPLLARFHELAHPPFLCCCCCCCSLPGPHSFIRLPIIQGGSFAYISPVLAIAGQIKATHTFASDHERFLVGADACIDNVHGISQEPVTCCCCCYCILPSPYCLLPSPAPAYLPTPCPSLCCLPTSMSPPLSCCCYCTAQFTMQEVQGGIIGSGLIVMLIGLTGIIQPILRAISPITVAANIGVLVSERTHARCCQHSSSR